MTNLSKFRPALNVGLLPFMRAAEDMTDETRERRIQMLGNVLCNESYRRHLRMRAFRLQRSEIRRRSAAQIERMEADLMRRIDRR